MNLCKQLGIWYSLYHLLSQLSIVLNYKRTYWHASGVSFCVFGDYVLFVLAEVGLILMIFILLGALGNCAQVHLIFGFHHVYETGIISLCIVKALLHHII